MIQWQKIDMGSCETVDQVPKGAQIIAVDGEDVRGLCEHCQRPITFEEPCVAYADGVLTCADECPEAERG
jgi:hypothetical protein